MVQPPGDEPADATRDCGGSPQSVDADEGVRSVGEAETSDTASDRRNRRDVAESRRQRTSAMTAPTLAASPLRCPPRGSIRALGRPCGTKDGPHARGFAATLPPEGEYSRLGTALRHERSRYDQVETPGAAPVRAVAVLDPRLPAGKLPEP